MITAFIITITVIVSGLLFYIYKSMHKDSWKIPSSSFPADWKLILETYVPFYNTLNESEKPQFEYKIHEFLLNCRITGIQTEVETSDKLMVAASAVIPIYKFKNWRYTNLFEVLLYPSEFNEKFETEGAGRFISGMVGTGFMEGKMILSKPALRHGFQNETDKRNTAIHEFVHLIDKMDGLIDGIPSILMEKQYTIPWIDLMKKKIDEIYKNRSDINPYAGTNQGEFFSVVSEYFFERPKLLVRKHPELYALLEQVFDQDMSSRNLNIRKMKIGRNDPCPCNSGKKFKNCCGSMHYKQ